MSDNQPSQEARQKLVADWLFLCVRWSARAAHTLRSHAARPTTRPTLLTAQMRNCADSVNRYISFLAGTQTTNDFLQGIIQLPNLHALNTMDPNDLPRGAQLSKKRAKAEDDDDEKPKKRKREKKEKDPNAPKRPPSAYIFFQNAVRQQMRDSNPDLPYRELVTKISERWKALPADEKKVYSEMAANEMDKWRTDTTDYQTRVANDAALPTPASEESGDSSDDEDIPVKTALTAVAKAQPAVESSSDSDESEAPPPPPVASASKSKKHKSSQPAPVSEPEVKKEKKSKKSKA